MQDSRMELSGESRFSEAERAEIRAELDRLLASALFATSARKARLLRYLVDAALDGRSSQVSEYAIGLDVFDKGDSFDPRTDSVVRAEISRLRQKLREYYAASADEIVIDIPQRGYAPTIARRKAEPAAAESSPPAPSRGVRPSAVLAGLAIVAVLAGGVVLWQVTARNTVDSIVVLPFQNLSADAKDQYLADGVTEELTNQLAQWPDLRVVARTSASQFKGRGVDVREIGKVLNVAAVLEGSFERQGDRIRVTAQLNRSSNGYHIWSKSFEAQSHDMMALQDQMARSIAAAVRGAGRAAPPVVLDSTSNPEAHDLYLRANYQLSLRTPDSFRESLALFQAAVEKDPAYVSAYRGIASAEMALVHITAEAAEPGHARARAALEKAVALDPHDAESLGEIANLDYRDYWDWPRAEREFQQAEEHGAQATTHSYYGWSLATRGRFKEAHRQFQVAEDLDPLNAAVRVNEVVAYYLERNYSAAERMLQELIDSKLDPLDGHLLLGLMAIYRHDCDKAALQSEWTSRAFPAPMTKFGLGLVSACRGQIDQARRQFEEAAQPSGRAVASPYQLALGYAAINDKETALSFLQKSAEAKEGQILYIKYEPLFDGIRPDARFVDLEKKVGLTQ